MGNAPPGNRPASADAEHALRACVSVSSRASGSWPLILALTSVSPNPLLAAVRGSGSHSRAGGNVAREATTTRPSPTGVAASLLNLPTIYRPNAARVNGEVGAAVPRCQGTRLTRPLRPAFHSPRTQWRNANHLYIVTYDDYFHNNRARPSQKHAASALDSRGAGWTFRAVPWAEL